MGRLDEIEKRIDARKAEIDNRIGGIVGRDGPAAAEASSANMPSDCASFARALQSASAFGFRGKRARGNESVRRVGLSVGLNTVDPSAYPGCVVPPLSGCIADVERLMCVLNRLGFETAKLVDEQATCASLYNIVKRLTLELEPGDLFVLHVSGHGGRESGRGENWCLYDGLAWDSDIVWLFSRFRPGVRVLVINDQCHSGGIFMARGCDMSSPFGRLCASNGRPSDWDAENAVAGADFPMLIQFAGCRAEQTSIDGLAGGTWTQALVNTLEAAVSQDTYPTYRQWFDCSFASPTLQRGRQDPQWVESAGVTDEFRGCAALF